MEELAQGLKMNGVDYTKKLSQEREYFQDSLKKNKTASDKRVSDNEQRTETIINDTKNSFAKDKAEIENNYRVNIDQLKDKIRNENERTNKEFSQKLEAHKETEAKTLNSERDQYDRRLNEIKNSYSRISKDEKDAHLKTEKDLKSKYDKNTENLRQDSERKVSKTHERFVKETQENQKKRNDQIANAKRDFENSVYETRSEEIQKGNEKIKVLNSHHQKTMKQNNLNDKAREQYNQERLDALREKYQSDVDKIVYENERKDQKNIAFQRQDRANLNRRNNEEKTKLKTDLNNKITKLEVDRKKRESLSGEHNNFVLRQKDMVNEIRHQKDKDKLKNNLNLTRERYDRHYKDDQKNFKDALYEEKNRMSVENELAQFRTTADKIITTSKEREKAEERVSTTKKQAFIEKENNDNNLIEARKTYSKNLNRANEQFGNNVKSLEDRSYLEKTQIKQIADKDKRDYFSHLNEERAVDTYEMKRDFGNTMDRTVEYYEDRLAHFQRENENLVATMNSKIGQMLDENEAKLESQRRSYESRLDTEMKTNQVLRDQKDLEVKTTINQLNANMQKKADRMRIEFDNKLKSVTNEYENKMKELRENFVSQKAITDVAHKAELEKLKQTLQNEKMTMASNFENQIQNLKDTHSEQLDQMRDFKRLS